MTTAHLPECSYTPGQPGFGGLNSGVPSTQPYIPGSPCICPSLRACEQRVREEESRNVIGSVSLAAIGEANLQQYQLGFATALDAAREAISKIPKEDGGYCHVLHACDVEAAIDDLRNPPSLPPTKGRAHKY